jgi:CubicO group peptidase (beta-lactamase class C family)
MPLSSQGVEGVKKVLDGFVNDGSPGLVFSAIDKSGNTLVEHATGTLGVDSQEPMDAENTLFWLASCTKLVTAIAVLQLVEQGKILLDDAEFVEKILPEIQEKKVYADGVNTANQQQAVTVSMLLSHTAGFAYAFIDPRVQIESGLEGMSGDKNDILNARLVNQPGSMWEYGINMDWAGLLLERVTGQTLGDYFAQNIFAPLGISPDNASFFPAKKAHKNVAHMHQRDAEGHLKEREHLFKAALDQETKEQQDKHFQSGGAGLWSRPKEYVKILAALLNDGQSPYTGKSILKKESIDLLWVNQIPAQYVSHTPSFIPTMIFNQTNHTFQTGLCPQRPTASKSNTPQSCARNVPTVWRSAARMGLRRILGAGAESVWPGSKFAVVDGVV